MLLILMNLITSSLIFCNMFYLISYDLPCHTMCALHMQMSSALHDIVVRIYDTVENNFGIKDDFAQNIRKRFAGCSG